MSGIVAGLLCVGATAYAQQTIVANFSGNSLTTVDLVTGNRVILSSGSVGTGPVFSSPVGIVQEADGSVLVGEQNTPSSIYRVNPITGNRVIISSSTLGIGTGPALGYVYGMAVESNGTIIAGVSSDQSIYRIDPTNGNRTVIASTTVGSGATMRSPFGLILDPDGSIVFVPWQSAGEVIRVNPTTLVRTVISSSTVGTGPNFSNPPGIVRMSDGAYAVINNNGTDYVLRVDPATGNRTVLSSSTVGTGPTIGSRYSIAIDVNGNLYVADFSANSIVKIDPSTGNRTTVSRAASSIGTGPALSNPLGMLGAVVASISSTPPTVSTTAAASVAGTSATLGGNVTAAGSASVTARGVVWSVTTTNAAPTIGGGGVTDVAIGSGTGTFSQSVTGLTSGVGYSFRAYATSTAGTSYGSVLTFTTSSGNSAPTDISLSSTSVNQTAGLNATVGSLSSTDSDSSSFTYSLVAGAGSTDNASFSISGASLLVNDPSALAGGSYSVRIQTDDGSGGTFEKVFSLTIVDNVAPVITSGTTASATYKTVFGGYTVSATGGATTYSATGLPSGLSINVNTGVISGTPTQSGSFSVTLGATDVAANTGNATLTLTVAKLGLTVSGLSGANKTYNASSVAALNTLSAALVGIALGDTVTLDTSSASASFSNANVGTAKLVTVAGLALGGSDAGNYTLTQPTTTANILSAGLTVSGLTANNKVYNASATATLNTGGAALVGVISGDTVTLNTSGATGTFSSATVGTGKVVTVAGLALGGADAGNYTLTQPTTTANITSAALTVSGVTAADKAYDGSTGATLNTTSAALIGIVSGDTVTLNSSSAAGTFANATVGSGKVVTVTGLSLAGAQAGNYTLTQPTTTASITSASAQVSLGTLSFTFDGTPHGTTAATVPSGLPVTLTYDGASNPPTNAGTYTVAATISSSTSSGSTSGTLTIAPAAQSIAFDNPGSIMTGSAVTLSATASSGLPVTFSVVSGNASLSGASLTINDVAPVTVRATQAGNSNYLAAMAELALTAGLTRNDRLINLSTRAEVSPATSHRLITGFIISGSAPKRVLLRAAGPALTAFGVQGALTNPRLQLFDAGGKMILENDDWSATNMAAAFAEVGVFPFAAGSRDAAIVTTLAPGAYTMQVSAGSETGIALAEIYDASVNPLAEYQRLVNISSRGMVGKGESILIGGFIIAGNSPKKVLIRGVGPALTGFGISDALADPRLSVYAGSTVIAQNDDWGTPQVLSSMQTPATANEVANAIQSLGAFTLGQKDAAVVMTLPPGGYTVQVSSSNAQTGVALLEIYELP